MYTHTHRNINKKEILPLVTTWMDLEAITLSEMLEKDKYFMICYTWDIKKTKHELIETEQIGGSQRQGSGK